MSLLMDMTLREFSQVLASSEPAPGGGSTAALSGVLASSLTMMVVNLSTGKKSFEALEENIRHKVLEDFEAVKALNQELWTLVDEDTKAFRLFMEAMKLPKETEEERKNREDSIQQAALYALQVPLKVAEKCLGILRHQLHIARYGNKNAVSDVGVGSLLAFAGLEGAALNVNINLPGISDSNVRMDASEKIAAFRKEGSELKIKITEVVNSRI